MIKILIAIIFTILLLVNVQASLLINECLEIKKDGEYIIENDLYANCECIIINSSNVIIDGKEKTIKNLESYKENCYAIKSQEKFNITIKNLKMKSFGNKICDIIDYNGDDSYGNSIILQDVNKINIENIELKHGCIGINIETGKDVKIKNITSINQSVALNIINTEKSQISKINSFGSNIDSYIVGSNKIKFEYFNFSNSLYGFYIIGNNNLFSEGNIESKIYDVALEEGINNSFLNVYYNKEKEFVDTFGWSEVEIIRWWTLTIYNKNKIDVKIYDNEDKKIFSEILQKNEYNKINIKEYINSKYPKNFNPYLIKIYKNNKIIYQEKFNIDKEKKIII